MQPRARLGNAARRQVVGAAVIAFAAASSVPVIASAEPMDPALNRLLKTSGCRIPGTGQYDPASGFQRCDPDNVAWAGLVAQYGFALAPTAMHSARTTGYGAFEIAIEGTFTSFDRDKDYWKNGTQGPVDQSTKLASQSNANLDPVLQTYMLKFRKGFPFGLELMATVGFMPSTSIVVGGADVRWSLFEGFRSGVPAFFPEFAVGGGVRTISGTDQMQLTVASADAQISKPIPIGGAVVLTPYVGYQPIWIFGDSGTIDLTPNSDAVGLCNYGGGASPVTPSGQQHQDGSPIHDGQPVCLNGGTAADFNNNVVFDPVRLFRHRINFGIQLRASLVRFGAHFITDLVDIPQAQFEHNSTTEYVDDNGATRSRFENVGKQWTLAFDLGALF